MVKSIQKLFGGMNLTWPKLIIAALIAGVFTAVMAIIPALHYTSFIAITVTFEVWILFGILIIMNSKSNLDSAWKCFVFFLISQPLVYLIQVPFSSLGWGLFGYYSEQGSQAEKLVEELELAEVQEWAEVKEWALEPAEEQAQTVVLEQEQTFLSSRSYTPQTPDRCLDPVHPD